MRQNYSDNEAGPSRLSTLDVNDDNTDREDIHSDDGQNAVEDNDFSDELVDGMDPEGFSGPSEKIVKPLTREALAAFKAIQDRAGVVYISRIPPGMRPTKVRHIMSAYGEIGRVYLQQEGTVHYVVFHGIPLI